MGMAQDGMGGCGSSSGAWRKERSASVDRNECICATPWSKNSCAFGFDVVIGKWTVPWPLRTLAGSAGAVPLGGGTHRSGCFVCSNTAQAATRSTVAAFIVGALASILPKGWGGRPSLVVAYLKGL